MKRPAGFDVCAMARAWTFRAPSRRPNACPGLRAALLAVFIVAFPVSRPVATAAAVWDPDEVRLSTVPQISLTTSSGPGLVALPDRSLYAVWYQRTSSRSSIVCGASRNPEGAWSLPERLSLGDSLSRNPTIAVGPGGDLHVVWEDLRNGTGEEIYYRHRTPAGQWDPEQRITFGDFPSVSPVIAAAQDGRLHLAWSDGVTGNYEIYHAWRDVDGTWSQPLRITSNPGYSRSPAMAIEPAGDVHLVWQDNVISPRPGEEQNTEIYYLRLSPDGTPQSEPLRISNALGTSRNPVAALGPDGALHVLWSDNRDQAPNLGNYFPFAIWYRRWLPGLGFGHEKRFSYSSADHLFPAVAVSPDGTINAVWEDYGYGNADLVFRQIHPATGWDTQVRMTQTVGPTRNPNIVVDADSVLHLLWCDTAPGQDLSIRYRTGQVDGTTAVNVSQFRAAWAGEMLLVSWEATTDDEHSAFMVQAAQDLDEEPETLGLAPISAGGRYETAIAPGKLGARRHLKLVAISRSGMTETVAVTDVPDANGPAEPVGAFRSVSPNPSRGTFTVPVATDRLAAVALDLLDVAGRRVAFLDAGPMAPGSTNLAWTPLAGGAGLAPGRYWVRVNIDGRQAGRAIPIVITR